MTENKLRALDPVDPPANTATRWSFKCPGIIAIVFCIVVVIEVVVFLFTVAMGGFGLFLAPLFWGLFKVLLFFLPFGFLVSSIVPSMVAFARREPSRHWSMLIPVLSMTWLTSMIVVKSADGSFFSDSPEARESKVDSKVSVGVVKDHFGPFGLEFHNNPHITFLGKKIPLRWVYLPENPEIWKGYQMRYYDPEVTSGGRVLVASTNHFSEEEYHQFFEYLQVHRHEIADALGQLRRSKENVPATTVAPVRDHIGIVYGGTRRYHSDPPGFLLEVDMEGRLRTEQWQIDRNGKVTGINSGGFPGQLVVQDGQLVLLLNDAYPEKLKKGADFYRDLIRSDHAPDKLPPGWNSPEAARFSNFAEVREINFRESLENYEWSLSTLGGRTQYIRFESSGEMIVGGEPWGKWSMPEDEILLLEPEISWPILIDERLRSNVWKGRGKYSSVSLLRGNSMTDIRQQEAQSRAYEEVYGKRHSSQSERRTKQPPVPGEPYENYLKMKFVPLPGEGESEPAILFAETEVTRGEFQRFLDWSDYLYENLGGPMPRTHPIIGVTWADANAFCEWLTEADILAGRLAPGQYYRLPTDHEWSRAAGIADREDATLRPAQKSEKLPGVYLWGDAWPPPNHAGNFSGEEMAGPQGKTVIEGFDDGYRRTSPVRSFPPNALGIYDLAGNVWEWCQDDFDAKGDRKTLRGGSYFQAKQLEATNRKANDPGARIGHYGFRCVLDLGGSQSGSDLNGGGKLSKDEIPEKHIGGADGNKDDAVTNEEIEEHRESNDPGQPRYPGASDIREKLVSLNEQQRRQLFETMKELAESNPEMSAEERRERMREEVEKMLNPSE